MTNFLFYWVATGALIGGLVTPIIFRNLGRPRQHGAWLGVIVGAVGHVIGLAILWMVMPYLDESNPNPSPWQGFRTPPTSEPSDTDVILDVRDIHTFIGQFHILEGVSVTVPRGSITVLLGRNGAGKTTTLRSIMGLNPASQGDITYNGRSIRNGSPHTIAAGGIGYVPEDRAIFVELTVEENLKIAARKPGDLEKNLPMIFELFPDLERLYALPGGNLSGGQQQMLAIARALVAENELLLIDEPSEGLAPVIIDQLLTAIKALSEHKTVLLVEQNFRVASRLADSYIVIDEGHSVASGAMSDLMNDPETVRRYLGVS